MAIEIVSDAPRPDRLARVRRGLITFVGVVLIVAGILATVPVVMIVLLVGALGLPEDSGSMGPSQVGQLVLLGLAAAACIFAGARLVRGKRRLVLFLRRFGFEGSSRALTFAVGTALGRRWRLITLDDAELGPVGVSKGARRTWGFGRWILLALAIVGTVYAISWIRGDAPGEILTGIFDSVYENAVAQGENPIGAFIGALLIAILLGVVILLFGVVFIFAPVAFAGAATLFTWGAWRAIRKAERMKATEVRTETEIEPTFSRVARRTRGVFGPRLVVLRAAHDIWQEVVRRLAASVSVVLIDVSEPTENLLWEIAELKDDVRSRWILVGRRDRVEALAADGSRNARSGADPGAGGGNGEGRGGGNGVNPEIASRLRDLLDGERVLVYEGEEKSAMRRFALGLRARFERLGPDLAGGG